MTILKKISEIQMTEEMNKSYKLGFGQLDTLVGKVKSGTIITIGARPAMGKSTFLNRIALNLLSEYNEPILYVGLETNKERLALQLACLAKDVSFRDVFNDDEKSKKILDEFKEKNYELFITDDCINIDDLESLLKENRQIRFLFIDYIQLLGDDNANNSIERVGNVLNKIKKLANEYNLVVILLSQLSRNVEYRLEKKPQLTDLKSCGNIENLSDIVIFLYRESYYSKEAKNDATEIIVSKNRYGSVGSAFLDYDKMTGRFSDY